MHGELQSEFSGTERFEVLHCLGTGGFGAVYRALDRRRNEHVALKVLHQRDADALYRFKREFRALADLSHPNLVALHELYSDGEDWFFTMELLEGTDFLSYVRGEQSGSAAISSTRRQAVAHRDDDVAGPKPPRQEPRSGSDRQGRELLARQYAETRRLGGGRRKAQDEHPRVTALAGSLPVEPDEALAEPSSKGAASVRCDSDAGAVGPDGALGPFESAATEARFREALSQLVVAVEALHRSGRLHRDIKPPNVIVTRAGRVVLLDFGLVTELGSPRPGDERIAGTVAYMAPEQLVDGIVTAAADWYSVGVMLYEALTGYLPYDGEPSEIAAHKQLEDPPSPERVEPRCPPDLARLTMELLARDPEARPSGPALLTRFGPSDSARAATDGFRALPPSHSVPPRDGPFVGRGRELGLLCELAQAAAAGRQVTVCVHGPSGIGKTGLVLQFVRQVALERGAIVLRGRCDERESVPYKALDRLVDELGNYLQSLPRAQGDALMPRHVHALARLRPSCCARADALADPLADARDVFAPKAPRTGCAAGAPQPSSGSVNRVLRLRKCGQDVSFSVAGGTQ